MGAWISDLFILKGFGIAAFIIAGLVFLTGVYIALDISKSKLRSNWIWGILTTIWLSTFFGFFSHQLDFLGGVIGYETNQILQDYTGKIGTIFILVFGFIVFAAIKLKFTVQTFINVFKRSKKTISDDFKNEEETVVTFDNNLSDEAQQIKEAYLEVTSLPTKN